jgi:myo-inositol-1(or 4)-monophosphatase
LRVAEIKPDAELRELLAIADAAAFIAGAALKTHREQWSSVTGEEGRETKIEGDARAEELIIEALTRAAPFPIISEERGWVEGKAGAYVWAVDPLDGSVNYQRRYPHCAVSIALLRDQRPILGVVDSIFLEERYSGIVGAGAWLNGKPISVSSIETPAKGILHTGVPAAAADASFALFEKRLRAWRKVRMIGSAAQALAYVAAGRAEAYRESGSRIWDVAGGCALVEAAGGSFQIETPLGFEGPLEVAARNAMVDFPD